MKIIVKLEDKEVIVNNELSNGFSTLEDAKLCADLIKATLVTFAGLSFDDLREDD